MDPNAPRPVKSRGERYLDRIIELCGGKEPRIHPIDNTRPDLNLPFVAAFAFQDTPEPGLITGFTYGLSLAGHPLWRFGTKELAITVASSKVEWPISIGIVAERLRGECPFEYGNTVSIGEAITDDTQMTGFVMFAPSFPEDPNDEIDVGDAVPVGLTGCYPIYASERDFITRHGFEEFAKFDWDAYDITRGPVVFD